MTLIDFIEIWWRSVGPLLEARGVAGQFKRSSTDRLNPSCNLNLRRGELEMDLLVWDSGEAELAIAEIDGSFHQQHFDNFARAKTTGSYVGKAIFAHRVLVAKGFGAMATCSS